MAIGLILLNAVLLSLLVATQVPLVSASQSVQPVVRARSVEIVDEQGRVRAEILVHGPETVNGVRYPETVLFRMIDQNKSPKMKLTVSEEGTALGLSDDADGGIQLYANQRKGDFLKVVDRQGRERLIKP